MNIQVIHCCTNKSSIPFKGREQNADKVNSKLKTTKYTKKQKNCMTHNCNKKISK